MWSGCYCRHASLVCCRLNQMAVFRWQTRERGRERVALECCSCSSTAQCIANPHFHLPADRLPRLAAVVDPILEKRASSKPTQSHTFTQSQSHTITPAHTHSKAKSNQIKSRQSDSVRARASWPRCPLTTTPSSAIILLASIPLPGSC